MKSSNIHLEQEIKKLEFQNNKLLSQIKTLATKGSHDQAKPLAKQVNQINNQIAKLLQFTGQMTAVNYKIRNASTMNTMAKAMSTAGNALQMTNQNLNSKKLKDIELNMQKKI